MKTRPNSQSDIEILRAIIKDQLDRQEREENEHRRQARLAMEAAFRNEQDEGWEPATPREEAVFMAVCALLILLGVFVGVWIVITIF